MKVSMKAKRRKAAAKGETGESYNASVAYDENGSIEIGAQKISAEEEKAKKAYHQSNVAKVSAK